MDNVVCRIFEEKAPNGMYRETYYTEDKLSVYEELSNRLIAKKIDHCKWITSVRKVSLYNGFEKIYVSYDNHTRDIFIVER